MCNKQQQIYTIIHILYNKQKCIASINNPLAKGIYLTLPPNRIINQQQLDIIGIKNYPYNGKFKMVIMPHKS